LLHNLRLSAIKWILAHRIMGDLDYSKKIIIIIIIIIIINVMRYGFGMIVKKT